MFYLFFAFKMRVCTTCHITKPLTLFHKDKRVKCGRKSQCKDCVAVYNRTRQKNSNYYQQHSTRLKQYSRLYYYTHKSASRAKKAKRHAAKMLRTPRWSELERIKHFYENCPQGYHVDHIVPLQGKTVSGLHVLGNLQYLTAVENISKGNKF